MFIKTDKKSDLENTIKSFDKAIELDPEHRLLYLRKAQFLEDLSELTNKPKEKAKYINQALKTYEEALETRNAKRTTFSITRSLLTNKKFITCRHMAYNLHTPDKDKYEELLINPELNIERGLHFYFDFKKSEAARDFFKRAIRLEGDNLQKYNSIKEITADKNLKNKYRGYMIVLLNEIEKDKKLSEVFNDCLKKKKRPN